MTKKYKTDTIEWKNVWDLKNLLHIILGAGLAVLAMKGFMIPNRFMDGGITGISILLHEIFRINISLLVIVLNVLFIYLGYRRIGKTFAVQTTIAVSYENALLFLLLRGLQFHCCLLPGMKEAWNGIPNFLTCHILIRPCCSLK